VYIANQAQNRMSSSSGGGGASLRQRQQQQQQHPLDGSFSGHNSSSSSTTAASSKLQASFSDVSLNLFDDDLLLRAGEDPNDDAYDDNCAAAAAAKGGNADTDDDGVDEDEKKDSISAHLMLHQRSNRRNNFNSSSHSIRSNPEAAATAANTSPLKANGKKNRASSSSPLGTAGTSGYSRSPVTTIRSLHAMLATSRNKKVRDEFQDFYNSANGSISQFSFDVNDAQSGRPFEDCYNVGKVLGEGGYATVYRCTHRLNNQAYAVKKIDHAVYEEEGAFDLKQEISAMKRCKDSVYVVRLLDVFPERLYTWMVMEECRGGDLLDKITELDFYQEGDARKVARTLLECVRMMHCKW